MIVVSFFFHFPVEAAFIFGVTVLPCNQQSDSVLLPLIMISVSFDHLGTLYIFILSDLLNHMTSCCHDSYYLPGPLGTAKINSLTKI